MARDGLKADLTELIIGCAIEVHRVLGPGLLESVYESAVCVEFHERGLAYVRQIGVPLYYKGHLLSEHRPDLIVDGSVLVEIKSVTVLGPIHLAQVLTYLRVTHLKVGLILNFNSPSMKQGIRRVIL
jgi:GxxExxY protein